MSEWLLTPISVPEAGIVIFKPGVNQLQDFKGRMLITPQPEQLKKAQSGRINHDQSLLDDEGLYPFFEHKKVIAAAGGLKYITGSVKDMYSFCQIHDDNYHHHELTTTEIDGSSVRTCWHHDTVLRENPFTDNIKALARRNLHRAILRAVSFSLSQSPTKTLTMSDLFVWTLQRRITQFLPEVYLRKLLNIGPDPLDDGPIPCPLHIAKQAEETVAAIKIAKAVVAMKINDEPPASFMKSPKLARWESKKYLKWVKSQCCCVCGNPADDPHHIIGHGQGGMGTKGHDLFCLPLCRGHHDELHRDPKLWESNHGSQIELLFQFLDRSLGLGVFG